MTTYSPGAPDGDPRLATADVDLVAAVAHAGQTDKLGVPYIDHVRAVAHGLSEFGDPTLTQAGLLHDVIEDTHLAAAHLRDLSVNPAVVRIVELLTRTPEQTYAEYLKNITDDRAATLVKISDNAHNSQVKRLVQLPADKARKLATRYQKAREVLWPAADQADIATILTDVNPDLLLHGNVTLV